MYVGELAVSPGFALVARAVFPLDARTFGLTLLLTPEEVTSFAAFVGNAVGDEVFDAVGPFRVAAVSAPPIAFDGVGLSSVRSFNVFHPLPPVLTRSLELGLFEADGAFATPGEAVFVEVFAENAGGTADVFGVTS